MSTLRVEKRPKIYRTLLKNMITQMPDMPMHIQTSTENKPLREVGRVHRIRTYSGIKFTIHSRPSYAQFTGQYYDEKRRGYFMVCEDLYIVLFPSHLRICAIDERMEEELKTFLLNVAHDYKYVHPSSSDRKHIYDEFASLECRIHQRWTA